MKDPDLMNDPGFLLARASGLIVRATNDALEPTGLRVRQYSVLTFACGTDGVTQKDLVRLLVLDPSQVVTLVDELVEAGLVERREGRHDRRTRVVVATTAGRRARTAAARRTTGGHDAALVALDAEERDVLAALLRRVVESHHPAPVTER